MTIGDIAQVLVAIGTSALALVTWLTLRQLRDQMVKSVKPLLIPQGHWLLPEGALAQEAPNVGTQLEPLEIENEGQGTALWVQWEVANVLREQQGAISVPLTHTYLTSLAVREKRRIWQNKNPHGFEVSVGMQIILWCDDVFGNHYQVAFQPRGKQWVRTYSRLEAKRPALEAKRLPLGDPGL